MFSATDAYAEKGADSLALIARVLIGWLFLDYGWTKLMGYAGRVKYPGALRVGPGRNSIDAWLRRH